MVKSFNARGHRVGTVGRIQIGEMQKRSGRNGDYEMGTAIGAFRVTTHEKAPQSSSFLDDQQVMNEIQRLVRARGLPQSPKREGATLKLPVYPAYDLADRTFIADRALYVGRRRACFSYDEVTADWTPSQHWPVPPDMREHLIRDLGSRQVLKCLGESCPLVLAPLAGYKDQDDDGALKPTNGAGLQFTCDPRFTGLFRLRGLKARDGIYEFETGSAITADRIYAALLDAEQLFGPNLRKLPMALWLTEHGTGHGSAVWRVNLQMDCSEEYAVSLALEWRAVKATLNIQDREPEPLRPARPLIDEHYVHMNHKGGGATALAPGPAPAPAPEQRPQPEPDPPATLTDVQLKDAISQARRRDDDPWAKNDVLDLLKAYKAERISEVAPLHRPYFVEALSNAPPPREPEPEEPEAEEPKKAGKKKKPKVKAAPVKAEPDADEDPLADEDQVMDFFELGLTDDQIQEVAPSYDPAGPLTVSIFEAVMKATS